MIELHGGLPHHAHPALVFALLPPSITLCAGMSSPRFGGRRVAKYNSRTMISDRFTKIESALKDNAGIPEATRKELLGLVAGLRAEVLPLVETHGAHADEIAGSTETAVQASIKRDQQPEQATQAVQGLAASVREFEATHPRLVEIVDQLAATLSNLGI